ncbi:MAG: DUF2281 domain-containing protein [Anaerolineae bacterium]|nr:DUF2281 domain-containing protein [Anaerolineae bacterium]
MVAIEIPFDVLLEAVKKLSDEQKQLLLEGLATTPQQPKERILGLHPGAIWTSDDFDDPLPDEFWLGEDA